MTMIKPLAYKTLYVYIYIRVRDAKVHLIYKPGSAIPCVSNLTYEKACLSASQFLPACINTGSAFKIELSNLLVVT
jgi:hypothetical protein